MMMMMMMMMNVDCQAVSLINHQSYFICQFEGVAYNNFVNISTRHCGRLPEKLQSSSSWSLIVTT